MKKKIILSFLIPIGFLVLTSSGPSTPAWEQENVSFPMMNQEIRHQMQENDRQKDMKNKQNVNFLAEKFNKEKWEKFKEVKVKIQNRLRIIDFAMQAIPTGYAIVLEGNKIAENQINIFNEIESAPYSLVAVLPGQVQFVSDLQMVIGLLTGIVLSYGAINQMEKAERKILLEYALGEVQQLTTDSYLMLRRIRDLKEKVEFNKFLVMNYINKDKKIIQDIMNHF